MEAQRSTDSSTPCQPCVKASWDCRVAQKPWVCSHSVTSGRDKLLTEGAAGEVGPVAKRNDGKQATTGERTVPT